MAFALLLGMAGAILGWEMQLVLVSMLVPALALLADYRLGLVLLILVLPFAASPHIPKLGPLNALNLLLLGVLVMFVVNRVLMSLRDVHAELPVPRTLLLYYAVPVTLALAIGYTHLDEITYLQLVEGELKKIGFKEYVIGVYVKQMLVVVMAVVIGASVIERKGGRLLLATGLLAGVLFVSAMAVLLGASGASPDVLRTSRNFLLVLGRHNNEAGVMLLSVLGPLMFMRESVSRASTKMILTIGATFVAAGVLFTVSRGAVLGMLVMLAFYVVYYRRLRTAFFGATVMVCAIALAPQAIQERLIQGIGEQASTASIADGDNELTSGRVNIWLNLAPEVTKSPVFGRGLLSTRWADFTTSGRYRGSHPHSLYLEILMDMGILGVACMFVFYRWVWRLFRSLGRDQRLPGYVRGYFSGSLAGFIGMLVYGLSNGHYYPAPEQVFFWVAVGLALGYSRLAPQPASTKPGSPSRRRPPPEHRLA
jgi:O-antigen ligase